MVTGELAPATDRLLTRDPAAKLLGVSESTFRRRIENVKIMAIVEGNVHRFRESEVRRYAMEVRRAEVLEGGGDPDEELGELTAVIFELLDEGVHPADVVKRLRRPAKVVEEIHGQWVRMRGIVYVDGEQIAKIRALDWTGSRMPEIRDGAGFVTQIQNLHGAYEHDAKNCERCHAARAKVCVGCYRLRAEEIKAQTRRYAEDAKTERAHYGTVRAPRRSTGAPASSDEAPHGARYDIPAERDR